MSALKERAQEIKQEGAQMRRDWNPQSDSAHFKVYSWWLKRSGKTIERENFCHYWRVVFIWAPLRWLKKPAELLLLLVAALGLGFVLTEFSGTATNVFTGVAVLALIIGYLYFSVRTFGQLLFDLNGDVFDTDWKRLKDKSFTLKSLAVFIATPVNIALGVLMLVVLPVISIFGGLHEEYDVFRKSKNWLLHKQFSQHKGFSGFRPWHVVPIVALVLAPWSPTLRFILTVIAIILMAVGVVLCAAYLLDRRRQRVRQRDEEARKARMDLLLQDIFSVLHPDSVGDQKKFEDWLKRYDKDCKVRWGHDVYSLSQNDHLNSLTPEDRQRFYELQEQRRKQSRHYVVVQTVQRKIRFQRWKAFLKGCGDFLELIWSVVLTRKWKICPMVELPQELVDSTTRK